MLFRSSNFAAHPGALDSEKRPTLFIHSADARARGIAAGDPVRVFNDRGSCRLWAEVGEDVRPGVVLGAGQWWDRHYPGGASANFTTPDFVADMGGGSAFNTNLVEVEGVGRGG